jgi:hypothetical protein
LPTRWSKTELQFSPSQLLERGEARLAAEYGKKDNRPRESIIQNAGAVKKARAVASVRAVG